MTIRIAHASDTHNQPSIVRQVADLDVDVLLLTGDCMGNQGRVQRTGFGICAEREVRYQQGWFRKHAKKWASDLAGTPVITVAGNHCFISLAPWLQHYGVTVYEITDENPMVEFMGVKFAGFRQINWMEGEWPGEAHDIHPHVEKALACDPTVLVTHAPPSGILDTEVGYGVTALTSQLFHTPHGITDHFFGHCHADGGQSVTLGGINFHNGAGHLKVHTVG
jgi:Icc-related predicted phosphoesterase